MAGDTETLRIAVFGDEIKRELVVVHQCQDAPKDILIVVRNQLPYIQACLESIRQNTKNYSVYVWDNGSEEETASWLKSQTDINLVRVEENEGFIIPNNRLAAMGNSPYVILLNSDTEVKQGWDKAMLAYLQQGFAQVGYIGGWLNEEAKGTRFGFGDGVDYIPGWCFAVSRATYDQHGLFDEENLTFAYCEDSDFSLRLTESGGRLYALHLNLVHHYENVTIQAVRGERDCRSSFEANHAWIKKRWKHRLGHKLLERKALL